jgi:hypothetical protein
MFLPVLQIGDILPLSGPREVEAPPHFVGILREEDA